MNRSGYWADLSADDFRALDAAHTVAVLPLGATEQHGPHLPVSVDRDLVDEVIRRGLTLLDGALPVLVLPTLSVGKSNEHAAFAGTLTLSAETLLRVLMELGQSVTRAGVRKLLLVNGHGGNVPVMDLVARDLRAQHGLVTAGCSWYALSGEDSVLDAREQAHGLHAGESETSAMLVVRGELVNMAKARDFTSASEQWATDYAYLGLGSRPGKLGWVIGDLNPAGACGNAAAATAEKGERLLATAAAGLAGLLREFAALPLDPGGADAAEAR